MVVWWLSPLISMHGSSCLNNLSHRDYASFHVVSLSPPSPSLSLTLSLCLSCSLSSSLSLVLSLRGRSSEGRNPQSFILPLFYLGGLWLVKGPSTDVQKGKRRWRHWGRFQKPAPFILLRVKKQTSALWKAIVEICMRDCIHKWSRCKLCYFSVPESFADWTSVYVCVW